MVSTHLQRPVGVLLTATPAAGTWTGRPMVPAAARLRGTGVSVAACVDAAVLGQGPAAAAVTGDAFAVGTPPPRGAPV